MCARISCYTDAAEIQNIHCICATVSCSYKTGWLAYPITYKTGIRKMSCSQVASPNCLDNDLYQVDQLYYTTNSTANLVTFFLSCY